MKSLLTTLAIVAFATPYIASAADTTGTSDTTTRREAIGEKIRTKMEDRFKTLDANNDGALSLDEFKAGRLGKRDPAKAEEIFNRMDARHDGKVTLDEFTLRWESTGEEGEDK